MLQKIRILQDFTQCSQPVTADPKLYAKDAGKEAVPQTLMN